MATHRSVGLEPSTLFELNALETLPCGCVAADYRARSLAVDLISLEVKGPYCTFPTHVAGRILGLGDSLDADEEDDAGNANLPALGLQRGTR